ncbi:MAG: HAD family hydrolase [Candidatus Aminicenantales bacterium]
MSIVSPNYKAVIFDLDGTLLDTIDDIAGAMNRVLEGRAFKPYGVEAYKGLVGDGIEEMVRRALAPRELGEEETAGIVRDYRREYECCWRAHSRPYSGVPELLGELARRGVKMAVLSNKSHSFTEAMTLELLAPFRFDVIRGAIPGVPLKPDPKPALMIAAEVGVVPAEVIFLGDTKVDMKTAVAAGMLPVGALWGFRSAEELKANGAVALIASPIELLAYFPIERKPR